MDKSQIIELMIEASKEDRSRFFSIADTLHLQPKYKDKLDLIEVEKQRWRDLTTIPNYPDIKWPLTLPDWFPLVRFASSWDVGYAEETVKRYEEMEKEKEKSCCVEGVK